MEIYSENFSLGFFETGEQGSKSDWFYFKDRDFMARDPEARLSILRNRLAVEIPKYSLSAEGSNDHLKFLFFRNSMNPETRVPGDKVPEDGSIIHETLARVKTYNTAPNPFDAPVDDYRLSNGAILSMDFDTRMTYGYILTDNQVFVLYGRMPGDTTSVEPAAFFTYIIPVLTIEPGSEHHYKSVYSKETYTVLWFVDEEPVFSWDEFGKRLPETFEKYSIFRDLHSISNPDTLPLVKSNQCAFGAGLCTFLDAGIRHEKDLVNVTDTNISRERKVFGQGGGMVLGDIRISTGFSAIP